MVAVRADATKTLPQLGHILCECLYVDCGVRDGQKPAHEGWLEPHASTLAQDNHGHHGSHHVPSPASHSFQRHAPVTLRGGVRHRTVHNDISPSPSVHVIESAETQKPIDSQIALRLARPLRVFKVYPGAFPSSKLLDKNRFGIRDMVISVKTGGTRKLKCLPHQSRSAPAPRRFQRPIAGQLVPPNPLISHPTPPVGGGKVVSGACVQQLDK